LRGVELVRDEFELGDRIAAEPRLPEAGAGNAVGHLLAVHVDLERDLRARDRGLAAGVGAASGRQQRQVEPVAAVGRQLLHLPLIDVGRRRGRRHVDERRFAGDGDGLLDRGRRQLQREVHQLADLHLQPRPRDGRKAGQFRRDAVRADAHRQAEHAAGVGHADECIAALLVERGDGHAGQYAARRVGDGTGDGGVLGVHCGRQHQEHGGREYLEHERREPVSVHHSVLRAPRVSL
jgi:hypothetical protein